MVTPTTVNSLELIADCKQISITEHEKFMQDTTSADGKQIRLLIKKHLPELYNALCLEFPNPYEANSVKKKGLLVYVHSAIEYFIKIN